MDVHNTTTYPDINRAKAVNNNIVTKWTSWRKVDSSMI